MYKLIVEFLLGLPRSGASPQLHSPLTHLPQAGLHSLQGRLRSHIYPAAGAPSCPLDYEQSRNLVGWFRPDLLEIGVTGDRLGSLIYYAKHVTVQIGKPKFDGGLMQKMKAQYREWDQAKKLGARETYVFRLLELFMLYYEATKDYLF